MRLLLALFQYFPYGGLQKDTLRFAEEALRRGHEVTLLTARWSGGEPPKELHVVFTPPLKAVTNTGRMDEFAREFTRLKSSGKFDVSLAMNRVPGADFYFAADSCMKAYLPKHHWPLTLKLLPRYRAILRQEAAIFAPSSQTRALLISADQRQQFREQYGTPEERLFDLPPGMDEACLPPADSGAVRARVRGELGLKSEELMILLVGTSFMRKGADRAIKAISALPPELRQRCHFYMVGNNSPIEIQRCGARCGVSATGLAARPNVSELLLAADLMLHPAREEGTGTVLIEALANSLPVICTGACGFAPYVAAAGGGVVPEPFRQEALNELLESALPQLPAMRRSAAEYAATQDFCARSRVAIEYMEKFVAGV